MNPRETLMKPMARETWKSRASIMAVGITMATVGALGIARLNNINHNIDIEVDNKYPQVTSKQIELEEKEVVTLYQQRGGVNPHPTFTPEDQVKIDNYADSINRNILRDQLREELSKEASSLPDFPGEELIFFFLAMGGTGSIIISALPDSLLKKTNSPAPVTS